MESSYLVIDAKSLDKKSWKVIGAGGFGQVYKARHLQRKSDVAIKILCLDDGSNSDKYLLRECELMRRAESPHVIQVLGIFKGRPPSASSIQIGLVMELMERGSLASLQKKLNHPLPWSLVFRLAHQVSLGMEHLHSLTPPIIHKDLKPDNVLLDADLNVKITDFGLSKFGNCSTSANSKGAGTTSYMAPEAFDILYKSTASFDVYSFGILLCSIVKGKEPYETDPAIIKFLIPRGQRPSLAEVDPEQAPGLEDLVDLMKRCWHQEPKKRPLFPECTAVTEALYEKHKSVMKDAVHQVITELDQWENAITGTISKKKWWKLPRKSEPLVVPESPKGEALKASSHRTGPPVIQDAVDNWTSGETDAQLVSEKHFVDKNRCFLIKNVTAVDPILDLLLQEDIITNDDYENVMSKSTHQDKTRKLYSFLKTSKDKDTFYQGLEEEEKLLLNKLDDLVRETPPKASSEPGAVCGPRPNASSEPDTVHGPQPKARSEPVSLMEVEVNYESKALHKDVKASTFEKQSSMPDSDYDNAFNDSEVDESGLRRRASHRLGEGSSIPELEDLEQESDPTLPSTYEVICKTEQITKSIQELLCAAQAKELDSFIPCSERIYIAVTNMAALFPKKPCLDAVRVSLRLLTSNAYRLPTECRKVVPSEGSPVIHQVIQQVIQCAYDLAKSAKQLVTIITKENNC